MAIIGYTVSKIMTSGKILTFLLLVLASLLLLETIRTQTYKDKCGDCFHNDHIDTLLSPLESLVLETVPSDFDQNCENMFKTRSMQTYNLSERYFKEYQQLYERAGKITKATSEGSSDTFTEETKLLHLLAQSPETKVVCETGFNLGYSALTYLTAGPHVIVHSFDIGTHPGTRPQAKYLEGIFGDRLNVYFGDSMQVLPAFHQKYPEVKCDVIFVDGGHTGKVPWSDIQNFLLMAKPGKSVMVFDDYPTDWGMESIANVMGVAWELVLHKGAVKELCRCSKKRGNAMETGFAVGVVLAEKVY